MPRIYLNTALILLFSFFGISASAQEEGGTEQLPGGKFPQPFTIAAIKVTGNKSYDQNLIISISGLAVGDVVQLPGSDAFSRAIMKLWKQNLVSDVQILLTELPDSKLNVEIVLKERPRLSEFAFKGIKKTEQDDLAEKMGLTKDRVLTENMRLSAQETIYAYYKKKGYRNISMVVSESMNALNNTVSILYDITKGKKVKINSINFTDNYSVSDSRLKKQMKGTKEMSRFTLYPAKVQSPYGDSSKNPGFKDYLKQQGFLYPTLTKEYLDPYVRVKFFSNAKFNETKYGEDKEKIVDFYNARGFRDAVIDKDTVFGDSKGNVNVDIHIKEGKRYYFGNMVWKGNSKYPDSVLNILLGIKKGDIYNAETLNKRLGRQASAEGNDINSLYQNDGYLFSRVEAVETYVYNDTIDHEIRVVEGPQATYGKITVSGNDKTKDYVILRELRTVPGEKYSREDIIRTQRELGQLGFLNPEKTNPNVVPHLETGTVDIEWQVEEKSADQLELSAGFGGGIGLTGTLGVTFNNFSIKNILKKSSWDPLPTGDGQKLSARIQSNGKAYRSYSFSFTEPWLGGKKRNSFSVSYYDTKFTNAFDQFGQPCRTCADTSFIKTIGFGIQLGKQLKWPDDYFSLLYSINVQQYTLSNYRLSGFSDLDNGKSTNLSFKTTLLRSSTGPSPIFPTYGSNFALSGQFTLPYSLLGIGNSVADNSFTLPEFHKWRFNADWYVGMGKPKGADKNKQFILRIAAKYGFIGRYNAKLQVSPFERFQVGDAGLSNTQAVLGYDIIAHRGYPVYGSSDPKLNPDGLQPQSYFTIFNKYIAEVRFPFSTNPSSTIYGLAFFEAANGWYDFKSYNPFKLRRSVGLGARFFLPMFGLLGFDYGIGLDRIGPTTGVKGAGKFTFMLGQEAE